MREVASGITMPSPKPAAKGTTMPIADAISAARPRFRAGAGPSRAGQQHEEHHAQHADDLEQVELRSPLGKTPANAPGAK